MTDTPPNFYAVVPAAGVGSRMGADKPKQYLSILGRPLIEHTLHRLLGLPCLAKLVVALSPQDAYWPQLSVADNPVIETVTGGEQRADSVLSGLLHLSSFARDNDWVLVHDVARPCVELSDIEHMIRRLQTDPIGGILAVPVSDTIKRVNDTTIIEATVDRSRLWQAQTPQMFRLGLLREALQNVSERGMVITDEASAIELNGGQPKVVEGSSSNIKVTRPEDLALAEYYCSRQAGRESASL